MRIRKHPYLLETIWMDKCKFDEAERLFHEAQQASAVGRAAQEAELARGAWQPAGEEGREAGKKRRRKRSPRAKPAPAADPACLDWHSPEEAERARRLKMAGLPGPTDAVPGGETRPPVACHHLVRGVWTNKGVFDEAERLFVVRSQARSIPRSLPIPGSGLAAVPKPQATPDEGYISATPATPVTPGFPSRTPATPVIPGFPSRTPATPVTPGFPSRTPATPVTPGFPSRTPATPVTPGFPSRPPASPSWRPPATKVWLEKPLYDGAERLYYETLHGGLNVESRGPRQATGRRPPGTTLTESRPLPARAEDSAAATRHLVHEDSEPVWFNKPAYDAAELCYHLAGIRRAAGKTRQPMSHPPRAHPPERPAPAPAPAPTPRCSGLQDKTMAVNFLAEEKIWFDKSKYDDAEMHYYINLNGPIATAVQNLPVTQENGASNILRDIARARENIQKSLAGSTVQGADIELCARVTSLEKENQSLHKVVEDLRLALSKLEVRLSTVERSSASTKPAACPPAPHKPVPKEAAKDDDDIDLFGSSDEEENAESERIREERLRQYAEKKSQKPTLIAKSSILLDVKPWDDETDMVKLEECVRTVQMDGLLWGGSKLVPVGYGIKKLQIQCVVEDDKVGTDQLEEEITKFDDYVQSVDVAAFNKI